MRKKFESLFGEKFDPLKIMEKIEEKLPNSIWIIDASLEDNIAWISSAVSMQRGYSPEEVMHQSLSDIFPEESLKKVYGLLQEEHEKEDQPDVDKDRIRIVELEMKCKDGTTIWTENQISFLHNKEGDLAAFLGITKDITENKLNEERKELSIRILECLNTDEDIYATIDAITTMIRDSLGIAGVLVQLIDDDTNDILYSRSSTQEQNGKEVDLNMYSCSLCNRKSEMDTHPYIKRTKQGSAWLNKFDVTSSGNEGSEKDIPLCIKKGGRSMAMVPIQTKRRVHGVLQMWSEREKVFNEKMMHYFERIMVSIAVTLEKNHMQKEIETQTKAMRHMQRIESVGRLAGGIAHDFNNLLTVIKGFGEVLLERDDIAEDAKQDLEQIYSAAQKAEQLTRKLLAFSRKQVMHTEAIEINDIFKDMQGILERLIKSNINIDFNVGNGPLFIEADKTQLEQIIMNIVINARDAMPEGGTITVTTDEKKIDKEYFYNHESVQKGKYASICIEDTGVGIPQKDLNAIFEPFYTTKPVNEGSGLGLSVVYGIVRQHNGHIIVNSTKGEGTSVEILLPMHNLSHKVHRKTENDVVEHEPKPDLKGKTIFFIEDDVHLQKLVLLVLKKAGAHVVSAKNLNEARKLFEENDGKFDIVFSDVALPDGDGPEFLNEICNEGYEGAVLLTSGYTFDADIYDEICNGKQPPFMEKPFFPKELIQRISSLIKEKK